MLHQTPGIEAPKIFACSFMTKLSSEHCQMMFSKNKWLSYKLYLNMSDDIFAWQFLKSRFLEWLIYNSLFNYDYSICAFEESRRCYTLTFTDAQETNMVVRHTAKYVSLIGAMRWWVSKAEKGFEIQKLFLQLTRTDSLAIHHIHSLLHTERSKIQLILQKSMQFWGNTGNSE